jgi:glycosyltransferase involved in cell wall biosynthesis
MDQPSRRQTGSMLSVIVATHESERALVRTLAVLVPGAAAGTVREVIVADGGSTDATAEVADIAGCRMLVSRAPLGARLKEAAASARAAWLMFLKAGTVLDPTWIDDTARFMEDGDQLDRSRAAVFRPVAASSVGRPVLVEALWLMRLALGRPRPEQGLVIAKPLYDRLGGHRDHSDPESDLLRRLGRRRIVMLRSGAVTVEPR